MSAELDIATRWRAKAANDLLDADKPSLDDAREARQCAERVHQWLSVTLPATDVSKHEPVPEDAQ